MENKSKYYNYIIIANELLAASQYDKALISFERAYKYAHSTKEIVDVLFEMADIYMIGEDYIKAQNIFRKIIEIDSSREGAYYGLSITNDFLKGDIDFSIENYKKAIEINRDYDRAYYYLGHIYEKIGKKDLAIEVFKECVRIDPYDFNSLNIIGAIYIDLKEYDKALFYIDKSLEVNPSYGIAIYNKGVLKKAENKNSEALKIYISAIDKYDDAYLFLNMSAIYIEENKLDDALDILNEGIFRFPDSVNLHYNKACVLSNKNEKKGALEEIKKAIEINKDSLEWAREDVDLMDIVKEL